jgi:hypothetical protein
MPPGNQFKLKKLYFTICVLKQVAIW